MNIAQKLSYSLNIAKKKLKGEVLKFSNSKVNRQGQDIWSERHLDPNYWQGLIHWGQIPQVANYINRSISGREDTDFIAYTAEKFISPLKKKKRVRMLSLCSGIGHLELDMIKKELVDEIIGFEFSSDCVARANENALAAGVSERLKFFQMDLNIPSFVDFGHFDFIFNEAALHHISNLENLISECLKVCLPHTLFINHDYVGPNHHQWTEKQLSYINRIMELIPSELRASRTNIGAVHLKKNSLPLRKMLEIDPTEGVRSEDILDVMKNNFDIIEFKSFGGTVLHMLLNDIAGNFTKPEYEAVINLLIFFEESLIKEGILTSDFAYWIAKVR
jgi:SAM-dependent methyltransferase